MLFVSIFDDMTFIRKSEINTNTFLNRLCKVQLDKNLMYVISVY